MEQWKTIEEFENYQVSDHGRVRSMKTGRILRTSPDTKGYQMVWPYSDGVRKTIKVHRLVARAFVKGYFEGAHVDHLDGNKLNNSAANLEWVTNRENATRNGNCLRNPNKSSKYPGVSWDKNRGLWKAYIKHNTVQYYLGRYAKESQGKAIYRKALKAIEENRFNAFISELRS